MPPPRGLIQCLDQDLHKSLLLPRRAKLLVAVSGGADSVALLRILQAINQSDYWRWELVVGHVDHGIRGKASRGDAGFTREVAGALGVACIVKTLRLERNASEDAARRGRLGALKAMARVKKCFAAVMAHHADDQAETVLLRLFRGAGLGALAGMAADTTIDGLRILRPLLGVRRKELRGYLKQVGQEFREDRTNVSDVYLRNRLRKIMPRIEGFAPGAVEAISRTAVLAGQAQRLVEEHVRGLWAAAVIVQTPRRVHLDRKALRGADRLVCAELLRGAIARLGGSTESADFERIKQAVHLIQAEGSGKVVQLGKGVHLQVAGSTVTLVCGAGGRA